MLIDVGIWRHHTKMSKENHITGRRHRMKVHPDSKVHGANMGPTWVLLAPDEPHVGRWTLLLGTGLQHEKSLFLKIPHVSMYSNSDDDEYIHACY